MGGVGAGKGGGTGCLQRFNVRLGAEGLDRDQLPCAVGPPSACSGAQELGEARWVVTRLQRRGPPRLDVHTIAHHGLGYHLSSRKHRATHRGLVGAAMKLCGASVRRAS
jgi:hypothetical protein